MTTLRTSRTPLRSALALCPRILLGVLCTLFASGSLLFGAPPQGETTVERDKDGDTVTAIRNLVIDNSVYDVVFCNQTTPLIYPPGRQPFDFQTSEDAKAATEACVDIINAAGGIFRAGDVECSGTDPKKGTPFPPTPFFRVPFGEVLEVPLDIDFWFIDIDQTLRFVTIWEALPQGDNTDVWFVPGETPEDFDQFPYLDDATYADFTLVDTIGSGNVPPTADAGGPYAGLAGAAIAFDGSASSDPDGETLTYLWEFGDRTTSTEVAPEKTYTAAATYHVILTVTDESGAPNSDTTTAVITVSEPPIADAGGPYTGTVGVPVKFDGTASDDPDGEIVTYVWKWGNGTQNPDGGPIPENTYNTVGTYNVTLTVTDDTGGIASDVTTVEIGEGNQPPKARAGAPVTGVVDMPVTFDGSGSDDPDGTITSWLWEFGDGNTSTEESPTHTYTVADNYVVVLTVTDNQDLPDSSVTVAGIQADGPLPMADAGGPYTGDVNEVVTFDGLGSTAGDSSASPVVVLDPKDDTIAIGIDNLTVDGKLYNVTFPWIDSDRLYGSPVFDGSFDPDFDTEDAALAAMDAVNAALNGVPTVTQVQGVDTANPKAPDVANIYFLIGFRWEGGRTFHSNGDYDPDAGMWIPDELFDSGSFNNFTYADFEPAPDPDIVAYDWDFGDGTQGTGPTPDHTYALPDNYEVTLTITDGTGTMAVDFATADINAVNKSPAAEANGPYAGAAGYPVAFTAKGSGDPDGAIVSMIWELGDGSFGKGEVASHTYTTAGTYDVVLTVVDDDGATDKTTTRAFVSNGMMPPLANAGGPYAGVMNVSVGFDGTGSMDLDGEITNYHWQFGDGAESTDPAPEHTYATASNYNVTLTVTDNTGLKHSDSTLAIVGLSERPVADAGGPYNGTLDTALQFDGSASTDPDGVIATYAWQFGDDTTGTGMTPMHTYGADGTYNVILTVTDDSGETDSTVTTAVVGSGNQAPVADAGGPYTGTAGVAVDFNGSASTDPEGGVLSYDWTFGDGNQATDLNPSHVFTAPGLYNVTLTVTDDQNVPSSDSVATVVVTSGLILRVDPNDPACSDVDGAPYCTVQGAIDNAGPGTTIELATGLYTENLVIGIADVTIRPEPDIGGSSVIRGVASAPTIMIEADGVTVFGLEVVGGEVGIRALDVSDCLIRRNDVHSAERDGILVTGTLNVIEENDVFDNGGDGIQLGDGLSFTTDNLVVDNNIFENADEGILLAAADDNAIENNTCILNFSDGIRLDRRSSGNSVEENSVFDNGHDGLESDGDDNKIEDNGASNDDGTSDGIEIDGDDNKIDANTVSRFEDGFDVDGDGNLFGVNAALSNRTTGFDIAGDFNQFLENLAQGARGNGFVIVQGASNGLSLNRAEENNGWGFVIAEGENNFLRENVAEGNRQDGFIVTSESLDNVISACTAASNLGFGMSDQSVGGLTAGTANLYLNCIAVDNGAGKSDPPGLAD